MKTTQMIAVLLLGAGISFADMQKGAGSPSPEMTSVSSVLTNTAELLAKNPAVSIDKVAAAVGAAVKEGVVPPSEIFSRVLASRSSWSTEQAAILYKSVLIAKPELASSFVADVKAYEAAGKPLTVGADAAEGVKVLAALYRAGQNGLDADAILASFAADSNGLLSGPVASLLDVTARTTATRRQHPVVPTPPATSSDN